jgi:hypothetical protein
MAADAEGVALAFSDGAGAALFAVLLATVDAVALGLLAVAALPDVEGADDVVVVPPIAGVPHAAKSVLLRISANKPRWSHGCRRMVICELMGSSFANTLVVFWVRHPRRTRPRIGCGYCV